MDIQKQDFTKIATTVIKNLEKRHMNASYFTTKEEAVSHILSLIPTGSSIGFGGSMTLSEIQMIDVLEQTGNYQLLDRTKVSPTAYDKLYHDALNSDYFLMSSNAITMDGKLINIDGTGNRVAALIYGPKNVIIVAGMNKIVLDEAEGIKRVHNVASPRNAIRLNKDTPCAKTGICHDCLSPDCICMQTVITRNSKDPNRISVILIGENLGY